MTDNQRNSGVGFSSSKRAEAKIYDERVSEKLRKMRLSKSMSQKQLASLIGLSYQQIQKYETGSSRVSMGRLVQICEALGYNPIELITTISGATIKEGGLRQNDQETATLINAFSRIKDIDTRLSVIQLVVALEKASNLR